MPTCEFNMVVDEIKLVPGGRVWPSCEHLLERVAVAGWARHDESLIILSVGGGDNGSESCKLSTCKRFSGEAAVAWGAN